MTDSKSRFLHWSVPLALVLVGLALGLVTSWPLPKHFATAVPYTMSAAPDARTIGMIEGDHLQYIYHLGQPRLAVEGRAPWFRNTYEFAGPYGFREFYVYFPTALLYWPLSYVSDAFAFNAIILLSFVGSMIAGYGLARVWGASRLGAFCAGVVLTLFPARLAALYGGHPGGSAFFLFAMALWGFEKSWDRGRTGWKWLAALSLVLLARLDPHYLFYLCFLLPFWAFWKLAEAGAFAHHDSTPPSRKRRAIDALPAFVAALIAAGSVHFNQIRLHVIEGFGPQIIALAAFFVFVVLAMRWIIARVVDWLGVTDESFRRLWFTVPWFALWLLAFYFLAGYVEKPQFGLRLVRACVGLFVLAQAIFLVVAAERRLLCPGRIEIPWRRIVGMWPVFAGLALAVAYAMYLKLAVFDVSGVKGGRTLHEVRLFSVPFDKLFAHTPGNEAFVGWIPLLVVVVFAVGIGLHRTVSLAEHQSRRRFWIASALYFLGLLLTCGPLVSAYFPLYESLYRLVPFFSFTRATMKYAVFTATFGAVATGLALTFGSRPSRRSRFSRVLNVAWPTGITLGVVLASVVVTRVGVSILPHENKAYAHVAEHSQGAPLLELPIWPGDSAHSAVYQYWTLRTHVPTINGYSPTVPAGYIEHISWPLYNLNFGHFGRREVTLCKELGVRFINFHEEVFPRQVSPFPATTSLKLLRLNPNLRLVIEDGPVHLFEILDAPAQDVPIGHAPFLTRYVPLDQLKRQVGRLIEDNEAQDGQALISDGREGQLFYGPFAVLPGGDYVALFRIKAHAFKPTDEIGVLDVYAKRDKTPPPAGPLVVLKLTGADWQEADGYRLVEVPFSLDGAQVVETRGWFSGTPGASLALDYVFIQSAPRGNTIRLEAEEFFHAPARLVEAHDASQGLLLEFDEQAETGQAALEERFVLLDAQTYSMTYGTAGLADRRLLGDFQIRRAGGDALACDAKEATFEVEQRAVYTISFQSAGHLKHLDYVELMLVEAPQPPEE
ncbi:MAG: hypothetical protein JW889_07790 [Verrucomicrobia bacterium]|nr:hypothetical protein [Verrucomicrobiota bacterium]